MSVNYYSSSAEDSERDDDYVVPEVARECGVVPGDMPLPCVALRLAEFIDLLLQVPNSERVLPILPFGRACYRVYREEPYSLSVRVDLSTGTRQVRQVVPWTPMDLPGLWARLHFRRQLDRRSFRRLACERQVGRSRPLQPPSR